MPESSLTSQWLVENWDMLRADCLKYLDRKFPTATRAGLGEDLFHEWCEKLLTYNTLESLLRRGEEPRMGILKNFFFRFTLSKARTLGQDPLMRIHGFRNHRDLQSKQKGEEAEVFSSEKTYRKHLNNVSDQNSGWEVYDPSAISPEDRLIFLDGLREYENIIRQRFRSGPTETTGTPTKDGRMVRIFRALVQNHTRAEIDEMEQCRTNSHITRLRQFLREKATLAC